MHAIVKGITAQEYQPKSKAAGEVKTLYQWVMKEALEQLLKHKLSPILNLEIAEHQFRPVLH